MKDSAHKILNILLAIIIIILLFKSCEASKDRDNLVSQLSSYKLSEKSFKLKIQSDSSTIATQTQTILSQQEAINLGLLKLDGQIKDVQSQVRQNQRVIIDSFPLPYIPNGYGDTSEWAKRLKKGERSKELCDSLIANSIIIPSKFKNEQKWVKMYGKVNKDGVVMDSLRLENEASVTIGWRKYGFLNLKREPIVELKNTNPYVNVTKVNNVVVKSKSGILHKKGFWFGVGVLGGIILKAIK
jgi:hypothetical protein